MNRIITILIVFLSFNLLATDLVDKKRFINVGTIHSLALDNHQELTIYLPESYDAGKNKFPVMYVIDGDKYFLNAITYQKTLIWQSKSPDFIVVGINIDKDKRRELLGEKSQEFINVFQNKIISYVENNYRTNSKRMYFGWELAGDFALDLFSKKPNLIDAYFLASSTNFSQERIDSVESILKSKISMAKFFIILWGMLNLGH
jgi:predicted alpha/beta superfamily hydrolase